MFNFRRVRKNTQPQNETAIMPTFDHFKDHPDEMFVCNAFLAVYSPALEGVFVVQGTNLMSKSEEELNHLLCLKFAEYVMNQTAHMN